ncbi:hypothetical protein [Micromonospora sp. RTP1Z1]|uniref:hypothetical protein n=1 Tax=Micromonospora sp. RTP1Z1 TaxID=2994043 RepID=UPI0029C7E7DC|nr:hypothetical protein [Micromonospora sp. RTP1Z1]
MPAERDQHNVVGSSQRTGLWPGQDIPRQQGDPAAAPALPWPDAGVPARSDTLRSDAAPSALPWPGAAEPTGPVATDVRPERGWPDTEHPYPADPDQAWPGDTGAVPPVAGGPDKRWPGAAPPPAPPGGPRRRWRLAVAAAVTLAMASGGVAVATLRQPDPTSPQAGPTQPNPAPTGAPAPGAGGPSATPSGVAGLGDRPASASPSASTAGPGPAFTGTRQTLPGASIAVQSGETFGQALSRSDRTFGKLRMARVFYPGLPPAWNGSRADVVDRTVVVSFKASPQEVNSGKYDSRLASWFASIPREHNVYWSYFHEPEDDVEGGAFTAAAYKSAWRRIAGLADRADNPKLINTIILMCWTLDPKSGRNFDAFYPGGDLVETLGWDCYNWGAKWKRYASPQEIYGRMISKSRELGKPWGVAETGSDLVPGDSGTDRATWIRSMAGYLNDQRPEFVAYYNQVVSQGDFRLQDSPSIQAWRSFCVA